MITYVMYQPLFEARLLCGKATGVTQLLYRLKIPLSSRDGKGGKPSWRWRTDQSSDMGQSDSREAGLENNAN